MSRSVREAESGRVRPHAAYVVMGWAPRNMAMYPSWVVCWRTTESEALTVAEACRVQHKRLWDHEGGQKGLRALRRGMVDGRRTSGMSAAAMASTYVEYEVVEVWDDPSEVNSR